MHICSTVPKSYCLLYYVLAECMIRGYSNCANYAIILYWSAYLNMSALLLNEITFIAADKHSNMLCYIQVWYPILCSFYHLFWTNFALFVIEWAHYNHETVAVSSIDGHDALVLLLPRCVPQWQSVMLTLIIYIVTEVCSTKSRLYYIILCLYMSLVIKWLVIEL